MKKIVIIDDSKFIANKISEFFTNELHMETVAIGYNGNEAIELYRKHQPDLLTLDISMPEKPGPEALKEILSEFPQAKVLIISAVRGSVMLECMKIGAKAFIEKPLKLYDPEFVKDFKESVGEALGEK